MNKKYVVIALHTIAIMHIAFCMKHRRNMNGDLPVSYPGMFGKGWK